MSFKIILEIETDAGEVSGQSISQSQNYINAIINSNKKFLNVYSVRYWLSELLFLIFKKKPRLGNIKIILK